MTQDAPAPGFLAALFPLTRYDDSLEVQISSDDGRLHVTVRALNHKPLEATGSPAALEKALPEAITKYARWVEAQEAGVADEAKITLPGEKAATSPRKKAPARKKPVVRRKPAARPAPKKKTAPRRAPTVKRRPAAAPSAGKPGKAECIADLKALRAKEGSGLTRRGFIKLAKTGRRYEKLWKNWEEFTAEALGKSAPASKEKPAAPAPRATAAPKAKKPTKAAATAKKDEKRLWAVKAKGKQIGATMFEKKPGDTLTFSTGAFVVQSIDAEKREIHVEPKAKAPAPPPASAPAAETPAATAPAATEQQPATTETT